MRWNTSGELWWGLTDLALVFFAVALVVLLGRTKEGDRFKIRQWQWAYLAFAVAALVGVFLHTIEISDLTMKLTWYPQYVILFEASRIFAARLTAYLTDGEHLTEKEAKRLRVVQCVLFAVTIVLHTMEYYSAALYVFLLFGFYILVPLCFRILRGKKRSPFIYGMLIALFLGVLSQSFNFISGIFVVLGHIFDMAAMLFVYFIAREEVREKAEN